VKIYNKYIYEIITVLFDTYFTLTKIGLITFITSY